MCAKLSFDEADAVSIISSRRCQIVSIRRQRPHVDCVAYCIRRMDSNEICTKPGWIDEAGTVSIISSHCRRCNSPCYDVVSPVTEMPGSKNKKKVNKRKGGAGTPAGSAKVPRFEDGEINTLGVTGLSRRSTCVTNSSEGKSGLSHSYGIIILPLSSDVALLIDIAEETTTNKGSDGDGRDGGSDGMLLYLLRLVLFWIHSILILIS